MSRLLLQFSHLYKSFRSLSIFEDISLSINQGETFALIGENGTGKTTLLQLLAGAILADSGHFTKIPYLTIEFLPQKISLPSLDISARAYLKDHTLSKLEEQMTACLCHSNKLTTWEKLHERYEQLGGYRQLPVEKITSSMKIDSSLLNLPMAALSSGQRFHIALAKVLLVNPDLLLLDEPTNHLDQETKQFLKEILLLRKGATIIVSHDRQFLNENCNRLIEIKNGKLIYYNGNYDFYLEEQTRLLENQQKAYEEQKEEEAIIKQKMKAMTFSKRKIPPPKDRNRMAYDCRGAQYQKSLQRNLDVLKAKLIAIETNRIPRPKSKINKRLRFTTSTPIPKNAIEIEQISKSFSSKVLFSNFTKILGKKDRILLVGRNGSGKTTLLRCIAGTLPIDRGRIRYAPGIKIGYLDQEVETISTEETPFQYFKNRFCLSEKQLRSELHKSAIGKAELLDRSFSTLSVGQKKRFLLLSIILEKPNVLLLDEPTNHLDLLTLETLEAALLHFEGAVLATSHDSAFIKKIATDRWTI